MKKIKKMTIGMIFLGVMLSGAVQALGTTAVVVHELDGTKIFCSGENTKHYTIEFLNTKPTRTFSTDFFEAKIVSAYYRYYNEEIATVAVREITTRVVVGMNYSVELKDGKKLMLDDYRYSYDETRFPVEFVGKLLEEGYPSKKLTCAFIQNEDAE